MHILVKTLSGLSCSLNTAESASIDSLKSQVASLMGVPAEEQKLIFNGKSLEGEKLILDYAIEDNSNVYLVVALEGGAKGKKKKKDTKKGKKKHKKKKVKLAILKYYKVEDGKVVRLRQMCKVCPPGTFIAEHADRLYCGRCHTAYQKVGGADKKGAAKADAKGGKKK
jgi:ubiquitin-small subunit ribosomal protein S27Ae